MTNPSTSGKTGKQRNRFVLIGVLIAGVGSFAALYRLIADAIDKVLAGQGLQTYRTVWLVELNYIGMLVLFSAILVALIGALFFWWREERHWLELEKKYGAKNESS
jgi:hypothetical protein